jgi:hypothetical protein
MSHRWSFVSLGVVGTALMVVAPVAVSMSPAYATSPPVGYSGLYGGYFVDAETASPPPTVVAADFQVPTVMCTKKKAEVVLGVEVNGFSAPTVQSYVGALCLKGKVTYSAGIAINGTPTALPTIVHPTDQISVTVSKAAASSSATFIDTTSGFTQTLTGAGDRAEMGHIGAIPSREQRAGSIKNIPAFSLVQFSNADVNGAGIGAFTTGGGPIELVQATHTIRGTKRPNSHIEIQPGSLVGTSSFQLTWIS